MRRILRDVEELRDCGCVFTVAGALTHDEVIWEPGVADAHRLSIAVIAQSRKKALIRGFWRFLACQSDAPRVTDKLIILMIALNFKKPDFGLVGVEVLDR